MSSKNGSLDNLHVVLNLPNLAPIVQKILAEWLAVTRHVSHPTSRVSPILKKDELILLDNVRRRLEKTFPDSTEIERNELDLRTYRSVRLFGKTIGAKLLFPWNLYMETRYGSAQQLLTLTARNLAHFPSLRTLPCFVDFLVRAFLNHSIPRTRVAVRLLRVLTNLPQSSTDHGFPSYGDLAQATACSERSVTNIVTTFLQRHVVSPRYLVDMGHLGFSCWQVEHTEEFPPALQEFLLRTYPIFPDRQLSVMYLPHDFPVNSLEQFTTLIPVQSYKIHWNLAQLHWDFEKSWQEPVRLLGEYAGAIPIPPRSIQFSFTDSLPSEPLSRTDFRILDQVQLLTPATYESVALNLGLKKTHVAERMVHLVAEQVALPYYNLNRIDLTSNLLLKWGDNEMWNEGLVQNLLAFPYAEMFIGDQGGNAILKVPPAWTPQVLQDVMRLREEGYDIWGTMSAPQIARWGISLEKMAVQYDEFFGWQWESPEERPLTN